MRDSIFHSSLRALFIAFFAIIGFALGIIALMFLVGVFSSSSPDETKLTTVYTEEILPNAEGERKVVSGKAPVILQINIHNVIGLDNLTDKSIKQILVESREGEFKKDRVKGLLLYINTPGGTVTDADGIYRAIMEYKTKYKVPVYAYVDGLCASGGMYIAVSAEKILASEASLIGSVGVIVPTFMNFTKLLDKVGVETLTISAGKEKDAMNPLRPWKPGEEDNFKQIIDYYYQNFVNIVAQHRPEMNKEKLIENYGARIYPAKIAQEYGYIDASGVSIGEAIKELVKAAGIEDNNYQVIQLENKGWWKSLFTDLDKSPIFSGQVKHQISISPETDLLLQNRFLYLYIP